MSPAVHRIMSPCRLPASRVGNGPVAQFGWSAVHRSDPEESIRLLTGWSGVRMVTAPRSFMGGHPSLPAGPLRPFPPFPSTPQV